ncbi:MAG TPA: hypothetical protein VGN12_04485 [Pirellulales bacterium]|jgi:hypothetical protein
MYLVEDRRSGVLNLVFTWSDPANDGFTGEVLTDVELDYEMEAVHQWNEGEGRPEACLGRSPNNPKHFKVFKYSLDRQREGYQAVDGTVVVFGSWREYLQVFAHPPRRDQLGDEGWFDYLDELDEEVTRESGNRQAMLDTPEPRDRDAVAEWLAKRHFIADSGIREVWYLPGGSPPQEIRLLELNDRVTGDDVAVEPIDFGLDIQGCEFRLFVADVTGDQLLRISRDSSGLPRGWSLDGTKIWRRRGA